MFKLVALFKRPADTEDFENRLTGRYLPLVRKLPGLRSLTVTRLTASPVDEDRFAVMAELLFESRESMDAAMASGEGKAANRELLGFAAGGVRLLTGVVEEGAM